MFILSEQLDARDNPNLHFRRYFDYLEQHREQFPAAAYALATSGVLLDATNHDCPHDGWLEWARFEEPASGERSEIRTLDFRVRLLGAYHDRFIELFYPGVQSYRLDSPRSTRGHGDWRYSELRLSDAGHVLHEIEWDSFDTSARWLIEATDVHIRSLPLDALSSPFTQPPLG